MKDQVATIIAEAHQQADRIRRHALSHAHTTPLHEAAGGAAGALAERDPVLWDGDGGVETGGESGDAGRRRTQGRLLHVPQSDADVDFVGEFVVCVSGLGSGV